MNFILFAAFLFVMAAVRATELSELAAGNPLYVLAICAAAFGVPYLTAYVCGRVADERYLSYALYPLIGFLALVVPAVILAGPFALLIGGFGVLGALNGSFRLARRAARRKQRIYSSGASQEQEEMP